MTRAARARLARPAFGAICGAASTSAWSYLISQAPQLDAARAQLLLLRGAHHQMRVTGMFPVAGARRPAGLPLEETPQAVQAASAPSNLPSQGGFEMTRDGLCRRRSTEAVGDLYVTSSSTPAFAICRVWLTQRRLACASAPMHSGGLRAGVSQRVRLTSSHASPSKSFHRSQAKPSLSARCRPGAICRAMSAYQKRARAAHGIT